MDPPHDQSFQVLILGFRLPTIKFLALELRLSIGWGPSRTRADLPGGGLG
jgi:hypothetical protein